MQINTSYIQCMKAETQLNTCQTPLNTQNSKIMSMRPRDTAPVNEKRGPLLVSCASETGNPVSMDDLCPVEKAAAMLKADADGIKPMKWLNELHYDKLKEANRLDPVLTRRIEAYRMVAAASEVA